MREFIHFTTYPPLQHHCPLMVHSKQQIKRRKQYNTVENRENKERTNQLFTPTSPNQDQYSSAFCQTAAGFLIPRARLSYSPTGSTCWFSYSTFGSSFFFSSKFKLSSYQ